MMTVRFPNGQAIQYNTAHFVTRTVNGFTDIYTQKDGKWIAQVPNTCVIECVAACRVYDAIGDDANEKLEALAKEIRSLKRKLGK